MTLPLLSLLREKNPNAEIDWVTCGLTAPLVQATNLVQHVYTVDEKKVFQGSFWQKGREVIKLWKKLLPFSYDLVLTAHPDSRYRLLTLPIFKKKHSFLSRTRKRPNPLSGRYHPEEYLRLVLGENCASVYSHRFPKINYNLPDYLFGISQKKPVAIAPGGAKNLLREDSLRRWPIEYYKKLIENLEKKNIPIVITGSLSDNWVLPYLKEHKFENLIGKTTLLDLVALYKHCRLLVTHDSGPLHLAKLSACKTIALFGPTNPREFAGPYVDVLWGGKNLSCAPCYDGKHFPHCKNNLCMKNISFQEVLRKVERALNTEETSIPCMQ